MSEAFVDLSYRGLNLGKRIKLTQVRPSTGYLEMPTPMPVGTAIGIATDDGVLLEAIVSEIHEQVGGSDRAPGMLVRPKLDAETARSWWKQRVSLPELELPRADADGKVTLTSRRESVPELVDDGRSTGVMDSLPETPPPRAASPSAPPPPRPASPSSPPLPAVPTPSPRRTNPGMGALQAQRDTDPTIDVPDVRDTNPQALIDDGKRTIAMSAIDLEALGLDPAASSGSMAAATDNGDDDDGKPDQPETKSKKKKKRR